MDNFKDILVFLSIIHPICVLQKALYLKNKQGIFNTLIKPDQYSIVTYVTRASSVLAFQHLLDLKILTSHGI